MPVAQLPDQANLCRSRQWRHCCSGHARSDLRQKTIGICWICAATEDRPDVRRPRGSPQPGHRRYLSQKHGLKIVGPNADKGPTGIQQELREDVSSRPMGFRPPRFWECATPRGGLPRLEDASLPDRGESRGSQPARAWSLQRRSNRRGGRARLHGRRTMGSAGSRLVIEEFMTGEEASFLVFADGTAFHPMAISQDHKRRFDGDQGPNTGGMGAYSIDTILTKEQHEAVLSSIIRPDTRGSEGLTGILYAGLMLTPNGTQSRRIQRSLRRSRNSGDSAPVENRSAGSLHGHGRASTGVARWNGPPKLPRRSCSWRPDTREGMKAAKRIEGLDEAGRMEGVRVYHAGTREQDGKIYTSGGRVLNVTARGATLSQALDGLTPRRK